MKQPSGLKNVFSCASLKCPSVEVTESDFLSRPRTRASKSPIVLLRPESLFPSLLRLIEELLTTCYILQHVTCDWKDPENKLGEFFSLIKPPTLIKQMCLPTLDYINSLAPSQRSASSQDGGGVPLTSPWCLRASQPSISTRTLLALFVTICVRVEISCEFYTACLCVPRRQRGVVW